MDIGSNGRQWQHQKLWETIADGWMCGRTHGVMTARLTVWICGCLNGWMDGWLGDLVVMFSRILNNPRPYCLLCASVSGF